MKGNRLGLSIAILFFISLLLVLPFTTIARADGDVALAADPTYQLPPEIVPQDHAVYLSIWIIDLYGYDYPEGSYIFDFFLFYSWSDTNITTIDWYIMNGYPTTPTSKQMVGLTETNGIKSEVWRCRATFDVDVIPKLYPFDTVKLPILIEVLEHGYDVELKWVESESGINPDFIEVGYNYQSLEYSMAQEHYPYNITLPQAEVDVVLVRDTYSALYSIIIPPLIFCVVSAFSFAFRIDDDNGFAIRIGLNTSMLITAVLFNIAQMDKMPPITGFNLYSIIEISVLLFISMNLITTIVGYVTWKYKEDNTFVKTIDRLGLLASFIVPAVVFLVIYLVSYV